MTALLRASEEVRKRHAAQIWRRSGDFREQQSRRLMKPRFFEPHDRALLSRDPLTPHLIDSKGTAETEPV
jgi:hypothetical protein